MINEVLQLQAFASNLESALDNGARAVAYRRCKESGEMVLVLWHEDGSEEHLYPSVLDEFEVWLRRLPDQEPEDGSGDQADSPDDGPDDATFPPDGVRFGIP